MRPFDKVVAALQEAGIEEALTPATAIDTLPLDSLDFLDLLVQLDVADVDRAAECETLLELAELVA